MAVTLDSIVKEYIIESGGATEHNYARLLQLAIKGLREIHIDVSGDPKAVYLTVSDNDTVNLPDDYINYLKIAVCDSETGNVHSLGWNKQMCLPRSYDDCGNISRPENNVNQQGVSDGTSIGGVWLGYDGGFSRNGEVVGGIFGIGGGANRNGYYRLDEANKMIVLQSM